MVNMDEPWDSRRILILGMTYPHYSKKYRENVCTGGLFADTCEMVRIHPIPRRYMDDNQRFGSFQWITAKVMKHPSDPRPESYRVHPESIELQEKIPPKEGRKRFELLRKSPHLCRSVEELKDRWERDRTSLGVVQPKEILGCHLKHRSAQERAEWNEKEQQLLAQTELPFERPIRRIDFPEVRFMVQWVCDDPRCPSHEMGILTWGLHELYRRYRGREDCEEKILQSMRQRLDTSKQELFLFLGNYRDKMHNFGLMDSYSCQKNYLEQPKQPTLPGLD